MAAEAVSIRSRLTNWGLAVLLASLGTGCAHQTMVGTLPPPSFDAPSIAAAPAPIPVAAKREPIVTTPRSPRPSGNIPASWVPSARPRQWQWIVIHHSATPAGGARAFDRMHREKGWDELGYHFVIGNGTDTGNGAVEVGSRWPVQKWGAHAKTPDNRFNDYGIGICLVGNFDIERPTAAQLQSLAKLTAFLMQRYHIPANRVLGHSDTGKATDCPGRFLNVAQVRAMANQAVAGAEPSPPTAVASTELLIDR